MGADIWPSGDHVWNGQRPASTPQPTAKKGKMIFWKVGSRAPLRPASQSVGRSKVAMPGPALASCTTAKMPIQMPTEPPTSISVSFIAPYSLRVEPQMPMSM